MNKLVLLVIVMLLMTDFIYAEELPFDRKYSWNKAGSEFTSHYKDTILLESKGLIGDGITLNDEVIKNILSNISPFGSIIVFPEGVFKFSTPLILPSNIKIIGQGAYRTTLLFDNFANGNLINISGTISTDTIRIRKSIFKGDSLLIVDENKAFLDGDYCKIIDNDSKKITSDWAKYSTGQIFKIKKVNTNEIILCSTLRRNYDLQDSIIIIKINPIKNVAIENLSIERIDKTENQTSNISLNFSVDCKISCITSKNCNFAHIDISNSTNIEIVGSYFESAFNYGGGGKGYGVMLQSAASECLVSNNIFKQLRHSMILQSGANGNVISYNYSIDPYWTDVTLPSNSAGDIVLHGNYPYANLIEGNICQNIVIDNSHGINGPNNCFFRNRAELYGIFMNTSPSSNQQSFIGNEVTNTDFLKGLYLLSGTDHFEFGNNVKEKIIPTGTAELSDNSYYLSTIPIWYKQNSLFPPIGIPNKINQFDNEAKTRYLVGNFTSCNSLTNIEGNIGDTSSVTISPNPASDYIEISLIDKEASLFASNIKIYNNFGECVSTTTSLRDTPSKMGNLRINVSHLPNGILSLIHI